MVAPAMTPTTLTKPESEKTALEAMPSRWDEGTKPKATYRDGRWITDIITIRRVGNGVVEVSARTK